MRNLQSSGSLADLFAHVLFTYIYVQYKLKQTEERAPAALGEPGRGLLAVIGLAGSSILARSSVQAWTWVS